MCGTVPGLEPESESLSFNTSVLICDLILRFILSTVYAAFLNLWINCKQMACWLVLIVFTTYPAWFHATSCDASGPV